MAYQFWSLAEDTELPVLIALGFSPEEIGEKLNRTARAVRKRAERRNLSFAKEVRNRNRGSGMEIDWLRGRRSVSRVKLARHDVRRGSAT